MRSHAALYVVATPIGNLDDITLRALEVLRDVAAILAEDTRRTSTLLRRHGVATPLVSLHEHNELRRVEGVLARLEKGESLALVSDAGTPLISDPGYPLVHAAAARGVRVVPVPGPSALTAALSVAGLPTDRFVFEGFLPARAGPRSAVLARLRCEPRTMVFYEAPHRIEATLRDLCAAFEAAREAVLARELTKLHEEVIRGTLESLCEGLARAAIERRGEFVIVVHGADAVVTDPAQASLERLLGALLAELPVRQAVNVAARATGVNRNRVYRLALTLKAP